MAPKKRPRQVVDLTESDDDASPIRSAKFPRLTTPSSSAQTSPSPEYRLPGSRQASSRNSGTRPRAGRLPSSQTAYDGEPEDIGLDRRVDGPSYELYGSLGSKVVGIRQPGKIGSDSVILYHTFTSDLQRGLAVAFDSNAIQVSNVLGVQIGHLPRTVAARLAPYMDRGDVAIEAILTDEKGFYDLPIRIHIFGTSSRSGRPLLEDKLKKDNLLKATDLKRTKTENELRRRQMGLTGSRDAVSLGGSSYADQPELSLQALTQASQAIQIRRADDVMEALAIGEDQLAGMPEADQPESLRSKLLPYQLQGLEWLAAKENPQFPDKGSPASAQLWKRDARGRYFNLASHFTVQQKPSLLSGGILADDMGLGKTLQVLGLILTGGAGSTLIVAPVSVMSNWEQQAKRHILEEHAPRVLTYHGTARQSAMKSLNDFDIVITSYGTLSSESPYGALFQANWRRVVLDEGHTIRNAKTKVAEAACGLKAQSRWVLTGTPIVNNVKDMQSLLKFLRITGGVEQPQIFNALIARPLASGDARAEKLLQSLMRDLCLRRTKDMKFVNLNLPPKTEFVHRIAFRPGEKTKYTALLSEAQGALGRYQGQSGTGAKGMLFQGVLERLLRLRQICCHWTLCRERVEDLLSFLEKQGVVTLNDKNKALLQEALRLVIESQEECPVCIDTLEAPVITHCKHTFCQPCISQVIEIQHRCPMCRARLTEDNLVEPAPEASSLEAEVPYDADKGSSKTEALLKIVQATLRQEGSKVVIFSQWTSFLTIIQGQLEEAGYRYTRVDGGMPPPKRDVAIHSLDNDPETRIMLASLGVCSVGLNLVSADTVILADSWWAPAIEDQAVDRVYRLGKTRPTTVWRLVMEDTVEERVLDIQSEKRELVGKAFHEKQGGKEKTRETRMADVLKLLA